jgi:hypothetical protein
MFDSTKDFRKRPKWQQFLINAKWKIRKNAGGVKGIYLLVVIMLMVIVLFEFVISPSMAPKVEQLKPVCMSICDYPV